MLHSNSTACKFYERAFGALVSARLDMHYVRWPREWQRQPWVDERAEGGLDRGRLGAHVAQHDGEVALGWLEHLGGSGEGARSEGRGRRRRDEISWRRLRDGCSWRVRVRAGPEDEAELLRPDVSRQPQRELVLAAAGPRRELLRISRRRRPLPPFKGRGGTPQEGARRGD